MHKRKFHDELIIESFKIGIKVEVQSPMMVWAIKTLKEPQQRNYRKSFKNSVNYRIEKSAIVLTIIRLFGRFAIANHTNNSQCNLEDLPSIHHRCRRRFHQSNNLRKDVFCDST